METLAQIEIVQIGYEEAIDYWQDHYPALQAARETAWEECEEAAGAVGREMKMRIVLVYDEPVQLYHAGRTRLAAGASLEQPRGYPHARVGDGICFFPFFPDHDSLSRGLALHSPCSLCSLVGPPRASAP